MGICANGHHCHGTIKLLRQYHLKSHRHIIVVLHMHIIIVDFRVSSGYPAERKGKERNAPQAECEAETPAAFHQSAT